MRFFVDKVIFNAAIIPSFCSYSMKNTELYTINQNPPCHFADYKTTTRLFKVNKLVLLKTSWQDITNIWYRRFIWLEIPALR